MDSNQPAHADNPISQKSVAALVSEILIEGIKFLQLVNAFIGATEPGTLMAAILDRGATPRRAIEKAKVYDRAHFMQATGLGRRKLEHLIGNGMPVIHAEGKQFIDGQDFVDFCERRAVKKTPRPARKPKIAKPSEPEK